MRGARPAEFLSDRNPLSPPHKGQSYYLFGSNILKGQVSRIRFLAAIPP